MLLPLPLQLLLCGCCCCVWLLPRLQAFLPMLLPLPLLLLQCGCCCCVWLLPRLYSLSVSGVRLCRRRRCKLRLSWGLQERRV